MRERLRIRGFQRKLYLLIIGVVLVFGLVATLIGTFFLQTTTLREAQMRVRNNLRGAWAVLEAEQARIQQAVAWIGSKETVIQGLREGTLERLHPRLVRLKNDSSLDFLTLTDREGRVVLRTTAAASVGDNRSNDIFVRRALAGEASRGFHMFPPERLDLEGEQLGKKAFLHLVPTPKAKPSRQAVETYGTALLAACPVTDENGVIVGMIYGGVLLNRNYELVDKIRSIVFGDELYKGKMVGTVTLFQWDVRISTNVTDERNLRAIGTRVSSDVYDRTLENGLSWEGRAFVVRDWYISAYDPMKDMKGEIIGMLYVGALEQKYSDMKTNLFLFFNAFTLLWILVVLALVTHISSKFITPIHKLASAARLISAGSLDAEIPQVRNRDEVWELAEAFRAMIAVVREREAALMRANRDLTATNRNYMGMLSFVSHELKNRIAGSSIAVHALRRNISEHLDPDDARLLKQLSATLEDLGEMLRNYLDLARLESHEFALRVRETAFVAEVVLPTLDRLSALSDEKNLLVKNQNEPSARLFTDPQLLSIVYYNLVHNAFKFCPAGGIVRLASQERPDGFAFEVWNEGEGIPHKAREHLFEKFYKVPREEANGCSGSGLGLFISKTLVEMLGGAITVESEEGKWTRFTVQMPRARVGDADRA
jgi:two-component system NtrC family sensor kinase